MKAFLLFVLLIFTSNTFSQNVSPQFSELKGMEDQSGNTHLLYHVFGENYDSIYHFDVHSFTDSVLFPDTDFGVDWVGPFGFDFWQKNINKYIYSGSKQGNPLSDAFIKRYDNENNLLEAVYGQVIKIEISNQNDSIILAGINPNPWGSNEMTVLSTDGGWNWNFLSDTYQFNALNTFNDSILFAHSEYFLYLSPDRGITYVLVDTSHFYYNHQFFFDKDQNHIYRVAGRYKWYQLKVSDNNGEAFSWEPKFSSDSKIFISIDDSISGTIYLANKKNIYLSTDYGDNFNLYRSLDDDIVGIYKKPDSGLLYAATKYRIYEIDLPDESIKIIKSITPASENYEWYPLSVGNYWLYEKFIIENGTTHFVGYETRHIVDNIVKQYGKKYFKMLITYSGSSTDSLFIRLDSTNAQIFTFDHSIGDELFFEDLSAELGDTVCYDYNPAWTCQYVQLEEEFSVFGLITLKKVYEPEAPGWYFGHSLVKGIGLYKIWNGDSVPFWAILKGCVIDGVVYGDTTVVSVEDETPNLATEFSLSQNYPNPFNPSTSIQYAVSSKQFVSLKVYDVLGNEITTLVNEELPAGEYEVKFDSRDLIHQTLPSGIYFYQLKTGSFIQTKKMLLLK